MFKIDKTVFGSACLGAAVGVAFLAVAKEMLVGPLRDLRDRIAEKMKSRVLNKENPDNEAAPEPTKEAA
jgi:hypothetical protein